MQAHARFDDDAIMDGTAARIDRIQRTTIPLAPWHASRPAHAARSKARTSASAVCLFLCNYRYCHVIISQAVPPAATAPCWSCEMTDAHVACRWTRLAAHVTSTRHRVA